MLFEYIKKVNSWFNKNKNDAYIAILIFFVSLASFGLGRLSVLWPKKEPITITEKIESRKQNLEDSNSKKEFSASILDSRFKILDSGQGQYVASKSGAAYHYPWCPGALKIKEENKIFFNTKEEAVKAGYKPAGNCPGL